MVASETGREDGKLYESEKLYSYPDDHWLTGAINGMKTVVFIHPEDPERYSLPLDDVPPSQYA